MKKYLYIILLFFAFSLKAQSNNKSQSVLANGSWIKVVANSEGIYKITYEQLKNWGISSPENVGVYTNGGFMLPKMNNVENYDDLSKIPVLRAKDNNNNDAIFFYSTGSVQWEYDSDNDFFTHTINLYSDKTYFYLSDDAGKSTSPTVKNKPTEAPATTINTFNDLHFYEKENINILKTGRRWYSDEISYVSSKKVDFNFEHINTSSSAKVLIVGAAQSGAASSFTINVNSLSAGEINFPKGIEANRVEKFFTLSPAEKQSITINYMMEGTSGKSWLDYITINQIGNLIFDSPFLTFRNSAAMDFNVVRYQIQTSINLLHVWDITNPIIPTELTILKNSNSLTFNDFGKNILNYVVFDPQNKSIASPIFVEKVANQNIHGAPIYDFVIVTHPDFIEQSKTLAEYHRQNDDMSVLIVTTNEVYNEFSSGIPDVAAIRNMTRMFYNRKTDGDSLRYLLLMGDGSFDNRSTLETTPNYIPTWQSLNSENDASFVSDDFFGLLDKSEGDSEGYIDIGIGRIPCRTTEDAEIVVNKTINYLNPEKMGEWRNVIAMIADDEDHGTHMRHSELIESEIKKNTSGFYSDKIYFDSFQQVSSSGSDYYPDATKAINQRVEDGALILNYIGHANEKSLAHENVLGISDINSWGNKNKLPIFVTATCEFSRFDDINTSAGEYILLNPAGGGIALFSTSRVVYSDANYFLILNFYRNIFKQDKNGNNYRMGDIMRFAKNGITTSSNIDNKRNFTLLGDPALMMAFPKHEIITTHVNNQELRDTLIRPRNSKELISVIRDTVIVGALDKVTIDGEVHDHTGNRLETFNGKVTTIVYDKTIEVQTLNNDGEGAFSYEAQNNVIYKGISSVINGAFQFSFIVPKDISYNIEMGNILYYATNSASGNNEDAHGATAAFAIGGSSENPNTENNPPEMDLYLNNENFRNHGKVASSSLLLVKLFDESGINMVGTGIGHDIVAVLDDDYNNPMLLNDFYSSELDNYQKGSIIYPLNKLKPGEHTLSVKVWDIQNNSTTKEISFIVEEGFEVTAVSNYPNPVHFETVFEISHNLPGDVFDITLEIFNLRGIKVYEINDSSGSYGSVTANVRWDISQTNYPIDQEKMLVYRVTLKNLKGLKAVGSGKLMLNKY